MSWELFVVKGDKEIVRGFVHGFVWGAGDPQGVFCEAELDLERESLASLLKLGPHQRLLVRANLANRLAEALEKAHQELRLELKERKTVAELLFEARARVFSPELAGQIKKSFFSELPPGVEVRNKEEEQAQDNAARGPELYAPVHHFEYRATCTFAGPVEAMVALHRQLAGLDFVEVEPLRIGVR